MDSYCGVTLTSMVAKLLEFLFLERLEMVFLEADLPHVALPTGSRCHELMPSLLPRR